MALPDIFSNDVSTALIGRINKLTAATQPKWGKMNAPQMLAHCNVTYEMVYEQKHPKPGGFTKLMLKLFVKNAVVTEKPYAHNSRTAPAFVITDEKQFDAEKQRLIAYIQQTQQLGGNHFHNKESLSFGALSKTEWNNMFYKHLDHHLSQFGV